MSTICPDRGALRRHLDRDTSLLVGDSLDAHVSACTECQTTLRSLGEDAASTARALAVSAGPPPTAADTEVALARVRRLVAAGEYALPAATTQSTTDLPPIAVM